MANEIIYGTDFHTNDIDTNFQENKIDNNFYSNTIHEITLKESILLYEQLSSWNKISHLKSNSQNNRK